MAVRKAKKATTKAKKSGGKKKSTKKSPKLTAKKRNKMKSSTFALPGKRKYPIDTIGRARNALARVAQYGTPAEKKAVRAAVHRKYPSIGK